jgi:hypothetical protein
MEHASVTISITDDGDGIEISVFADPEANIEVESEDLTPAQDLARKILEFIVEEMGEAYEMADGN